MIPPFERGCQGRDGALRFQPDQQSSRGASVLLFVAVTICLLAAAPNIAAQLQIISRDTPQTLFPGEACPVAVIFHNAEDHRVIVKLSTQLYQASSATAAPLGRPRAWKALEILAGQTILETNPLAFPSVAHATRFIIQWLDATNRVLGISEVMVYPTNLLDALRPLANKKPLGVFDPQNQIKPLLTSSGLVFQDLEEQGIDNFSGRLAIIGPTSADAPRPEELAEEITDLARAGAAVVWIKAEAACGPVLEPALYNLRVGQGAISIVRSRALLNLTTSPLAQLNFVRAAQLAIKPDLLSLNNPQP
jgi:hypothetical protein